MSETRELLARALRLMPGGVNSPVRAFRAVGGEPFLVREAHGATLVTTDGAELTDYVTSWGALLHGHDHPAIREAIVAAASRGTSYGATSPPEIALAQLVVDLVPSLEMVRFVNSGTEATMAAIRLARAATGREVILKFEGCYHGHGDSFLVAAGSGVATLGLPDSPGVPAPLAQLTVTARFNDLDQVNRLFREVGDRIAAVIVEPYVGNAGFIPPRPGFLAGLRAVTERHGALLIFDEVMTGFRVALGGAQELCQVRPDLTTLGKVIGGGLPVGAYGGRRDLMERVAPQGPVYQAGTLSGNPLAMAAGLVALELARAPGFYATLDERAGRLAQGLAQAARSAGVPLTAAHQGGMWGFFFHPGPVTEYRDARASDTELFARFHRAARELGVFLPPSAFEACFVSSAHTDEIIDRTIERLGDALARAARG